jgi:hypothetical protein
VCWVLIYIRGGLTVADIGVTTVGQLAGLGAQVTPILQTLTLHLYSNDVSWSPSNVVGDYTEVSWSGYAAIALTSWGSPFTNGSGQAEVDEVIRNFLVAGGGSYVVQGYYLTVPSGALYAAVSNGVSGGVTLGAGAVYSVLPKYINGCGIC